MGLALVIALDLTIVAYFIWRVFICRGAEERELIPDEYEDQQDWMAW